MFFNWISLIAGLTAFWFSFDETRKASGHYQLIGAVVGLAVGAVCFIVMKLLIKWLPKYFKLYGSPSEKASNSFRSSVIWFLLFVALIWICVSAFIGAVAARSIIHIFA
jgi:multisubunit Na+/H+ antiporter MnhB subunit